MRASRLLSILTTLQARGRVTAPALAAECEVSVRTIYRDIDALAAAGVPVYADRGAEGGYRLLDGYRVRLNGLSSAEAEALFLSGLEGPAADLGLGSVLAAAQTKLAAALPQDLRASAERLQTRFHFDAPGWFGEAERPPALRAVADAVWRQKRIRIRYRSWRAEKTRALDPLGLVLKGGAWYLAGGIDGTVRTYRIGRILDLIVTEEDFERPAEFDLAAYWRGATERLEAEMHPNRAVLRVTDWGRRMIAELVPAYVREHLRIDTAAGPDGRFGLELPVGSTRQAAFELARYGAEIEVVAPAELREAMARQARAVAALYPDVAVPPGDREADRPDAPLDPAGDEA